MTSTDTEQSAQQDKAKIKRPTPHKSSKTKTTSSPTALRDKHGRFVKGSKPNNGLDKNPQNIAAGGFWRQKKDGKAAILDIFNMSLEGFQELTKAPKSDKSVLDEVLCRKFSSALAGDAHDTEYLLNQAYGEPLRLERKSLSHKIAQPEPRSPLADLTKEDLLKLLGRKR